MDEEDSRSQLEDEILDQDSKQQEEENKSEGDDEVEGPEIEELSLEQNEDDDLLPAREDRLEFPISYRSNTRKEEETLEYVQSFLQQYKELYPHRKPVPVTFLNDCGIEKFICCTIRVSPLPYKELENHQSAARFVADYISYEPLEDPLNLNKTLVSPSTTLWTQRGDCLSMSVVLASILEGAGYNAYVVVGYASRAVCYCDYEDKTTENKQKNEKEQPKQDQKAKKNKYSLKLGKKLGSRFDSREKKNIQKEQSENEKSEDNKEQTDELYGLRTHAWVLVRPGRKQVVEPFFIEPSTGDVVSLLDPNYLGLEYVCSSSNVWINMQLCRNGLVDMLYNLEDTSRWEPMYVPDRVPTQKSDATLSTDLAPSWVSMLSIDPKDFQTRCPRGKKTRVRGCRKTKIFAHYLNADGLVRCETLYQTPNLDPNEILSRHETFSHRSDCLINRFTTFDQSDEVKQQQFYLPGHPHHLRKVTTRRDKQTNLLLWRETIFYDFPRADGLQKRVERSGQIDEVFYERLDRLTKRKCVFEPDQFEPCDNPDMIMEKRLPPLQLMETHFKRDDSIDADIDPAFIAFYPDCISATYHRPKDSVSACRRVFTRPGVDEKQEPIPITRDHVELYDPRQQQSLKNFELYDLYQSLLHTEKRLMKDCIQSLQETVAVVKTLYAAEEQVELEISVYDTTRNGKARERRKQEEEAEKQRKELLAKQRKDYLAPYLVQLANSEITSDSEAQWVRKTCLQDLMASIERQIKRIKRTVEEERRGLETRQSWYKANKVNRFSNTKLNDFRPF